MSTNMTGFRWFSKNLCHLMLCVKVALALEGLRPLDGRVVFYTACVSYIKSSISQNHPSSEIPVIDL